MNCDDVSTAQVEVDVAVELAQKALKNIPLQRQRDARDFIESEAKKINALWYRKLFRLRPITDAEVVARCRNKIFDPLEFAESGYSTTRSLAWSIIATADKSRSFAIALGELRTLKWLAEMDP